MSSMWSYTFATYFCQSAGESRRDEIDIIHILLRDLFSVLHFEGHCKVDEKLEVAAESASEFHFKIFENPPAGSW